MTSITMKVKPCLNCKLTVEEKKERTMRQLSKIAKLTAVPLLVVMFGVSATAQTQVPGEDRLPDQAADGGVARCQPTWF